ncbi:MAG: hypothetical protein AB9869_29030 [Verrucomicrobiia bacterium]
MAWRIQENVTHGEIDNRTLNVVRGRVWLKGRSEPMVLDLRGNACPDLAGCVLTFNNRNLAIPILDRGTLASEQVGTAGDLTASRKVQLPDVPLEEFVRLRRTGVQVPHHAANCLYLEWFSDANGRVVIEGTDFDLTVSPAVWTLSAEQERRRQEAVASGFSGFIAKLNAAIENARTDPPPEEEWDEFDYEKLMRESDAQADKYLELLDKYRNEPDCEQILTREMGWNLDAPDESEPESFEAPEFSAPDPGGESESNHDEGNEDADEYSDDEDPFEMPLEPDRRTEGIDWVRTDDGCIRHPLALRAQKTSAAVHRACKKLGPLWLQDEDLLTLTRELQVTAAKIGGALNPLAYGRAHRQAGLIIACLKRALSRLHAAQAALEQVSTRSLLSVRAVRSTRMELFKIREEILRLMGAFRQHGMGGF